jgi:DNA-binding beta-propeller fold protein YncE
VVTAEYTYYLYDREWGGTGIAPGKFNNPVGIAFDDEYEYIYVVDFGNNRIQVFASDGTFRRQWGTEGSANGMLDGPIDIAIDDGGKVYVTEKFNQRIQRFNRQGQYQEKWSTLQPFGIDVAPGGTIYNTNGANMVVEWGPDGAARSYEGFAHPYGIAASDDGCVYVANALADQVLLLRQTSDGLLRWHSSSANTGLFDRVSLDYPCGVAVGPEGDVFVADTLNNRIVKLDWCLNFGSTFGSEGDGPAEFNRPMGIAVGSDGSVYVTDTDNDRVQKFVPRAYSANNSTTVTLSRGITQAAYNVALTKPVTKGTMPFLVSSALARGENEMASPGKAYAALDVTQAGMPAIVAVPYDRNATATPLPVLYHSKDSPKPGDKNQTPIPLMLMMGDMNATATPSAKATATGTPGTATPTPNVIPSGPDNATFPDSGANSSTAPGPTDKSATGTPLPTTVGSEGAWLLAMLSLAIIAFAFSLYGGAKRK